MKKVFALILAAVLVLSLAACGGEAPKPTDPTNAPTAKPTDAPTAAPTDAPTAAPTEAPTDAPTEAPTAGDPASVEKAVDGMLTLSTANLAVVINGNTVSMPYRLSDIISAGVSVEDFIQEMELAAGDFFNPNIFIDEDWNYGISPSYYNESEDTISITNAQAQAISMFTYEETPEDQNISILGVKFGMTKTDVITLLGEPMWSEDDYCEWQVTISDAELEGNFTIYFVSDADDAGISTVSLSVHEPW